MGMRKKRSLLSSFDQKNQRDNDMAAPIPVLARPRRVSDPRRRRFSRDPHMMLKGGSQSNRTSVASGGSLQSNSRVRRPSRKKPHQVHLLRNLGRNEASSKRRKSRRHNTMLDTADSTQRSENMREYLPDSVISFITKREMERQKLKLGPADEAEVELALPQIQRFTTVSLFIDLAGFTSLTEKVYVSIGALGAGERGALEVLVEKMNLLYTKMLKIILEFGGDATRFAGDALEVIWPESAFDRSASLEKLLHLALNCALLVSKSVTVLFDNVNFAPSALTEAVNKNSRRSVGANFTEKFKVKIGVGIGDIVILHLGGADDNVMKCRHEYICFGPAVDEAHVCEKKASAGEVIIRDIQKNNYRLGRRFQFTPLPKSPGFCSVTHGDNRLTKKNLVENNVHRLRHTSSLGTYKESSSSSAPYKEKGSLRKRGDNKKTLRNQLANDEIERKLWRYVPIAAVPYIGETDHEMWLPEFRPVTTLFINLGICPDTDLLPEDDEVTPEVQRFQDLFLQIQNCVFRFEGTINKFLVDKGSVVIVVFGLPPFAHVDDAKRGVLCAMSILDILSKFHSEGDIISKGNKKDPGFGKPTVGVTTGTVLCGVIGSFRKSEDDESTAKGHMNWAAKNPRKPKLLTKKHARREYSIIGDSVNVASRLMVLARDTNACLFVDGPTVENVRKDIPFINPQKHFIKGKSEAMEVYEVRGISRKQTIIERRNREGYQAFAEENFERRARSTRATQVEADDELMLKKLAHMAGAKTSFSNERSASRATQADFRKAGVQDLGTIATDVMTQISKNSKFDTMRKKVKRRLSVAANGLFTRNTMTSKTTQSQASFATNHDTMDAQSFSSIVNMLQKTKKSFTKARGVARKHGSTSSDINCKLVLLEGQVGVGKTHALAQVFAGEQANVAANTDTATLKVIIAAGNPFETGFKEQRFSTVRTVVLRLLNSIFNTKDKSLTREEIVSDALERSVEVFQRGDPRDGTEGSHERKAKIVKKFANLTARNLFFLNSLLGLNFSVENRDISASDLQAEENQENNDDFSEDILDELLNYRTTVRDASQARFGLKLELMSALLVGLSEIVLESNQKLVCLIDDVHDMDLLSWLVVTNVMTFFSRSTILFVLARRTLVLVEDETYMFTQASKATNAVSAYSTDSVFGKFASTRLQSQVNGVFFLRLKLQLLAPDEEKDVEFLNLTTDETQTEPIIRKNWQVETVPQQLVRFLQTKTNGNPLFIVDAVQLYINRGFLKISGAKKKSSESLPEKRSLVMSDFSQIEQLGAPGSVESVCGALMDRLSPIQQLLLKTCAICSAIGYENSYNVRRTHVSASSSGAVEIADKNHFSKSLVSDRFPIRDQVKMAESEWSVLVAMGVLKQLPLGSFVSSVKSDSGRGRKSKKRPTMYSRKAPKEYYAFGVPWFLDCLQQRMLSIQREIIQVTRKKTIKIDQKQETEADMETLRESASVTTLRTNFGTRASSPRSTCRRKQTLFSRSSDMTEISHYASEV